MVPTNQSSIDSIDESCHVICVSLHPGVIPTTPACRSLKMTSMFALAIELIALGTEKYIRREKHKTVAQGAATTVFCALHPSVIAGQHYADCALSDMIHNQARDEEAWCRLWEITESLIDQRLDEIEKEGGIEV